MKRQVETSETHTALKTTSRCFVCNVLLLPILADLLVIDTQTWWILRYTEGRSVNNGSVLMKRCTCARKTIFISGLFPWWNIFTAFSFVYFPFWGNYCALAEVGKSLRKSALPLICCSGLNVFKADKRIWKKRKSKRISAKRSANK